MRGERALAIVNPAAGKGGGRRLAASLGLILAAAGLPADVVLTTGREAPTFTARHLRAHVEQWP